MTEEQQKEAEIERQMELRCLQIQQARQAIMDHAGTWKRGEKSVLGEIACPVCKNAGTTLRFVRVGINGHVRAKCQTPNCVSWME